MKAYDRVKINDRGARHYGAKGRINWVDRRGVVLWNKKDDDRQCAVVWDGTECEQYVLKEYLEVCHDAE